jgi:hypothetical protein
MEIKAVCFFFVFYRIPRHIKSLNPDVLFFQDKRRSANVMTLELWAITLEFISKDNSSLLTTIVTDTWTNIKNKTNDFCSWQFLNQRQSYVKDIITDGLRNCQKVVVYWKSYQTKRIKNLLKFFKRHQKLFLTRYLQQDFDFKKLGLIKLIMNYKVFLMIIAIYFQVMQLHN